MRETRLSGSEGGGAFNPLLLPYRWIKLALGFILAAPAAGAARTNVLFVVADDLRCDLGCYGHAQAKTPNLDRLAKRGLLFERAYCAQALCNPSRASMFTGLRPDRTGVHDLKRHFRDRVPDAVTLPQCFKQQGYEAVGIGKIFHNLHTKPQGDPASWSRPQAMHWGNHRMDQPQAAGYTNVPDADMPAVQCLDVPDEAYLDGRIAAAAVAALRELKDRPFFLAVGFWKPHLPYNAPKRYWDLYDRAALAPPSPAAGPEGAPELARHGSPEPRGYAGVPKEGPLPEAMLRELRHGYLAGISFLDAQVGKVLDALDRLGLAEQTIVVFWADNGYHLGEHGLFGKLTNYELDARVPLMLAVPGARAAGARVATPIEALDVYPTLAGLCGLTPPTALDGRSLVPLLDDPAGRPGGFALTQHPRPASLERIDAMGYAVRTPTIRYVEWRDGKTGSVLARELYDEVRDPGETRNVIEHPPDAAALAAAQAWMRRVAP